jgi:hypothetical protein
MQVPAQSLDELQNRAGLGLNDGFHDQLSGGIPHCDGNRCRVHIHGDVFATIHRERSFLSGERLKQHSKFTPQGRSFILAKKFRATGLAERFF